MTMQLVRCVVLLCLTIGCHKKHAAKQIPIHEQSPLGIREPNLAIDIAEDHGGVVFSFKLCDGPAEPFVEVLRVTIVGEGNQEETMCEFEAPDEKSVLKGSWKYGEARPGVGRCWPLREGTYFVTAIGSGASDAKFSLRSKFFGSGYALRRLAGGCRGS
jgi:hypothetical protein